MYLYIFFYDPQSNISLHLDRKCHGEMENFGFFAMLPYFFFFLK